MRSLIETMSLSASLGSIEPMGSLAVDPGSSAATVTYLPLSGAALAPALLLMMPVIGLVICTLSAIMGVRSKLPAFATVLCLVVAFGAALLSVLNLGEIDGGSIRLWRWLSFHWEEPKAGAFVADVALHMDGLSTLWMLFVAGLAALIALYASEYMEHDLGPGYCRFFAAFNLFVLSMACLVMADNLVLLYLGWEGVGLCSYLLIGYFYKRPSAVAAAKKAFIVNRIGDLGLALGIMLAFVEFGTVRYSELFAHVQPYVELALAGHFEQIPATVQWIPVLLMIGAFGKSAQFPLYVWLPDAMEGPTPVSALIHAATMVTAGVFLIARCYPLFQASQWALPVVAWVGTITAVLSATIGMAQWDIKRIMAYSTCSQLGFMFAGLGLLTTVGAAAHVFTHAFFKASLFLCCGAVMHGFAGQLDLRKLSGLWRVPGWRIVTIAMLVGCLNLAGFPLITAGYWSKDIILAEAFTTPGFAILGWLLLFTAGLTAYYTFRVFFRVFMGPTHYELGDEHHGSHDDAHGHDHAHAHDHAQGHDAGHAHHSAGNGAHHAGPHAPRWAINSVLLVLTVLSFAAVGTFFVGGKHGWVGDMVHESSADFVSPYGGHHGSAAGGDHAAGHDDHASPVSARGAGTSREPGTFLGSDPHKVMYYVSAGVGVMGIIAAFVLHLLGRTSASEAPADRVFRPFAPIRLWAEAKWYVDELYHFLFRRPLWFAATLFAYFDKLVVDGLVDLLGFVPRWIGSAIRPSQSGVLHNYAIGMAAGIAAVVVLVGVLMLV